MNRHVIWGMGLMLVAAGPAAAQTGSPSTGTIPKSNKTLPPSGTGTGSLNLAAPIPRAGGFTSGTSTTSGGSTAGGSMTGGATAGSGMSGGSGAGYGNGSGMGYGNGTGGTGLSTAEEVALLAQARLFVTQLESTGNLSLNRRESRMLTLLLYEALRQQTGASGTGVGTGTGAGGATPMSGITGSTPTTGAATTRP
ncbi:MAG TPA: hypothetical protein VH092_34495 [Urbifossiella sp.]|nr:hypothetical protein [Urbifossiella sp.]